MSFFKSKSVNEPLISYDYALSNGFSVGEAPEDEEKQGSPKLVQHYTGLASESLALADYYRTHTKEQRWSNDPVSGELIDNFKMLHQ